MDPESVVPEVSRVNGKDAAVAVVSKVIVLGPSAIVANVEAVAVGKVKKFPVADAAVPFSVNLKLLDPLVTVTVALVEAGRVLTVSVWDDDVGSFDPNVWLSM